MSLSHQTEIHLQDPQLTSGLSSDAYTDIQQTITKWVLQISISENDRRKLMKNLKQIS